jgi:transcriptional regulator with XRE-family HTH domain
LRHADEAKRRRERLGAYLKQLRERAGPDGKLTQEAAAKLIFGGTEDEARSKQMMLARIESGHTGVKPETLRRMAIVYGEPLDRLVAAHATVMFYDSDVPHFLADRSRRPLGDPENLKTVFFVSNVVESWSLAEIADWERELPIRFPDDKAELWIVSPDFIDHENREFLEIVVDCLLMKGVGLTYFVDNRDAGPGGRFDIFLDQVSFRLKDNCSVAKAPPLCKDAKKWGDIAVFGLLPNELTWFTSGLVIANPQRLEPDATDQGFRIFSVEMPRSKLPQHLAIPLRPPELARMVNQISHHIERHEREAGLPGESVARTWDKHALRSNRFFREFGYAST